MLLRHPKSIRKRRLKPPSGVPIKPKKGEITREKILRAAELTFAQRGYDCATLSEVAKCANIRQPGIYNYFKTKRDLYEAVLIRMMKPLISGLGEIASQLPLGEVPTETKLVDLLIENQNIPRMIFHAFVSRNQIERRLGLNWIKRIVTYIPRHAQHRDSLLSSVDEKLKDMVLFNAWLGYFWAAPIIEWHTGRRIADSEMLNIQKGLLNSLTVSL